MYPFHSHAWTAIWKDPKSFLKCSFNFPMTFHSAFIKNLFFNDITLLQISRLPLIISIEARREVFPPKTRLVKRKYCWNGHSESFFFKISCAVWFGLVLFSFPSQCVVYVKSYRFLGAMGANRRFRPVLNNLYEYYF